jgi:hypothetical protein
MDINNEINNVMDSVSNSNYRSLLTNPIQIAIIITAVIVIILIFVHSSDRLFRTSFYIFSSVLFWLFIHNKLIMLDYKKKLCNKEENLICSGIDNIIKGGGLDYLTNI